MLNAYFQKNYKYCFDSFQKNATFASENAVKYMLMQHYTHHSDMNCALPEQSASSTTALSISILPSLLSKQKMS